MIFRRPWINRRIVTVSAMPSLRVLSACTAVAAALSAVMMEYEGAAVAAMGSESVAHSDADIASPKTKAGGSTAASDERE